MTREKFDLDQLSDCLTMLLGHEHKWTTAQIEWCELQWSRGADYAELAQWLTNLPMTYDVENIEDESVRYEVCGRDKGHDGEHLWCLLTDEVRQKVCGVRRGDLLPMEFSA